MKNKIIRTFTVTLAAVLCLTAFSTTAFAGGTDPNPEPLPETTEAPQEEEPTTGGMDRKIVLPVLSSFHRKPLMTFP